MNPRKQVLELELKTVRAIRLSKNAAVAQAALEREKELRLQLRLSEGAPARTSSPPQIAEK